MRGVLALAALGLGRSSLVYDPRSGAHVDRGAYLATMERFQARAAANLSACAAEAGLAMPPVLDGRVLVWHPIPGSGLGNQLEALANAVLLSLLSSRRLEIVTFENTPGESLVAYLCTVMDCGFPTSTGTRRDLKRLPNFKPVKPCNETLMNAKRGVSCKGRSNTTAIRFASVTRMGDYGASARNAWAACVGRLFGCYGYATGANCAVGQALRLALPGVAEPLLDVVDRRFNGSAPRLRAALDAPKPRHVYAAALHIRTVDNAMLPDVNRNASARAIERVLLANAPFWGCLRRQLLKQVDASPGKIRRVFVASDNAYLHARLPAALDLPDDVEVEFFNFGVRPHTGATCNGNANCDAAATATDLLEQTAPFLDWATLTLAEHIFALRLNAGTCARILAANGDPDGFTNPGGVYAPFDAKLPEPPGLVADEHLSNTFVRGTMSTFVNTASLTGESQLSSLRSAKDCDFASRPAIPLRPAADFLAL